MILKEQKILEKFESDKPALQLWGKKVNNYIISSLKEDDVDPKLFLKIDPEPRLKTNRSLISKAFYRGKSYSDPYGEIMDKIGVRYVVLIMKDIERIKGIIENNKIWKFEKDRDFEEERVKNPLIFDYQSVHYLVINNGEQLVEGITIPGGICCEVQIRTLLQHAYAELTHDTIYKPKFIAAPKIKRAVSKSMALIETTDDIFFQVSNTLNQEYITMESYLKELYNIFDEHIQTNQFEQKLNNFILDAFQPLLVDISTDELNKFYKEHDFIFDIIKNNYDQSLLYKQPVVLLIYFLINKMKYRCKENWPLTPHELQPFLADLGEA